VSFISLRVVLDGIIATLRPGGQALLLVKPQFEATKAEADRGGGVIVDDEVRRRCIAEVKSAMVERGFRVVGEVESAVPGPAGNREHWIRASIA
jgi:23S rRNA (cytidine1920-2'-O)/16S rRNA (cytidine1409-2'-O)-methyltransferase